MRISSRTLNITLIFIYFIMVSVIIYQLMHRKPFFGFIELSGQSLELREDFESADSENQTLIIVITPTYSRLTQLADMTRMANTLMHVPYLHWIIIEDGISKNEEIDNLLARSKIPYSYFTFKTQPGYPSKFQVQTTYNFKLERGWYQRTVALTLLRNMESNHTNAVVYFGDDDNSYDIRVFTEYIRNVKKLGMWAVGHAGHAIAESLYVKNGKVIDFDVVWGEWRKFAVDMAGFAIHLDIVLKTNATFGPSCAGRFPEPCLLEDMGFTKNDIEPFGFDKPIRGNREVYVWHTQTVQPSIRSKNKTIIHRILGFFHI